MEIMVQLIAIVLSLLLAAVKSLRYQPNSLSEFELQRQVHAGNHAAVIEQERRGLLPTYLALQSAKEIIISVAMAAMLIAVHGALWGPLLTIVYFFAAYLVAARGWLDRWVHAFQVKAEPKMKKHIAALAKALRWFASQPQSNRADIASRDELRQLIMADTRLLAPEDKARLLGAFDFGSLIVADAMMPAEKIVTVDIKETVGPVLLDRLHKAGHNMFPVVKKDIDHIKGWLYMSDLTPLDPELKEVKDALRPTVHYIPANASLQDVLAASLITGRQLFIAVDDHGGTQGLVTLADAMRFLNGEPLPKVAPVSTKPEIVQ